MIAVKADGQPVDFTCLAQPSLARAADAATRGGRAPLATPLGRFLKHALYANGAVRGLDLVEADAPVLRLLSWTVAAPAGKR